MKHDSEGNDLCIMEGREGTRGAKKMRDNGLVRRMIKKWWETEEILYERWIDILDT